MANDPRRKGMPRRTPEGDAFRTAVYDATIDELAGTVRSELAGELHTARESCRRADRTEGLLYLATGIHEHGDPCLFCGRPGEEVEPWWPSAAWLDRLGCPAGHPGIVLLLVCRACCKAYPSPHGGGDTNPTRAAILRASRGSGPPARWMTEGEMKGSINNIRREDLAANQGGVDPTVVSPGAIWGPGEARHNPAPLYECSAR